MDDDRHPGVGRDPISQTAPATDGYSLAIRRFPAEGHTWATMLIAGAMAVRQDFYAPIARFFAANGVHVLTFDYRGMGASRPAKLRGFEASVTVWAQKDMNAMLTEARKPAPHLPLLLLGHSLGGQILGIVPDNAQVAAAINVTAGSGYYRFNEAMWWRVRLLWFVTMPLLTPLFGYFPGKSLRMVGDLPRGVADQWRRWCLHPEYLLAEGDESRSSFLRVTAPICAYSFADDEMINRRAVESLNSFYGNARVDHRHVTPTDVNAVQVGHFGFFSERSRNTMWQESLETLRAQVGEAERDQ